MPKKIITILAAVQVLLIVIQFVLTLGRATDGDKLYELQTQAEKISLENAGLKSSIYKETSIAKVREYALSSGFVPQSFSRLDPAPVAVRMDSP